MKSKKIIFIIIGVVLVLCLIFLYGRYIGTSGLVVKEYMIKSSEIPNSFDGLKLVHFSDLHYGNCVEEKELKNIVDKINYLKPDIVVFTGDLIDEDTDTNDRIKNILVKYLSQIDAKIGKYAVVGNHDYKNDYYIPIMEESGFDVLNNNYDLVYNGDLKPIFIGGIGNYTYKKADVDVTLSYFNEKVSDLYKIILVHEPDITDSLLKYNVDLVLAGHSHNGQVSLPFIGAVYTPELSKKYYAPYYKIDNTELYISSGIGCSKVKFRLFNKPSINFYRFSKSK